MSTATEIEAVDFLYGLFPELEDGLTTAVEVPSPGGECTQPADVPPAAEEGTILHSLSVSDDGVTVSPDVTAIDPASVGIVVEALLTRLQTAEEELQASSQRIGFLQNEIDKYKDKFKLLPDFAAQARKAAELEEQNAQLKRHLPELELRARRLVSLQRENDELRTRLEAVCATRRGTFSFGKLFTRAFWRGGAS